MVIAQEKVNWQEPLLEKQPRRVRKPAKKAVRKNERLRSVFILILVFLMVGGIGAGRIYLSVIKNAEVKDLEKNIAALEAKNATYQLEVDKLRSVSRIESAALAMGMEKPAGTVYVTGTLPAVKKQTGVPSSQDVATAAGVQPSDDAQPSKLKQISQLFTSFFASTQR